MTNKLTYWTALATMQGVWQTRRMDLFCNCYTAGKCDADEVIVRLFEDAELQAEVGMTPEERAVFEQTGTQMVNIAFLTESLLNQGYNIVPVVSAEYPQLLKANMKRNAPLALFTKGNLHLFQEDSIAIVGSRNADSTSLRFADNVAKKAASEGKVVVSGGAKGVDNKALASAIENAGKTIVVIPQGITTYGKGMREMYQHMLEGRVLVVSQFHPNAPWSVPNAMMRNSIIYSLAHETYVAESDSHGGTWSGATEALRCRRKVYVRWPEAGEQNANILLAQKGAIPVDMLGNVKAVDREDLLTPEEKELKQVETEVKALLKQGQKSIKEICSGIHAGWGEAKVIKWLKSQEYICTEKKGNRRVYFLKDNTTKQGTIEF